NFNLVTFVEGLALQWCSSMLERLSTKYAGISGRQLAYNRSEMLFVPRGVQLPWHATWFRSICAPDDIGSDSLAPVDVSWMDDLALLLSAPTPGAVVAAVGGATATLLDECLKALLHPNLDPGKTEEFWAILHYGGKWCELARDSVAWLSKQLAIGEHNRLLCLLNFGRLKSSIITVCQNMKRVLLANSGSLTFVAGAITPLRSMGVSKSLVFSLSERSARRQVGYVELEPGRGSKKFNDGSSVMLPAVLADGLEWLFCREDEVLDFTSLLAEEISVRWASWHSRISLHLCQIDFVDWLVPDAEEGAACADAIVHAGGRPIPIDCDLDSYGLSLEAVRSGLEANKGVVGIVIAPCYGVPARDFGAIQALCKEKGLWLCEDACESYGASCNVRGFRVPVGSMATLSVVSVRSEKMIGVGEGGAILGNDATLVARAKWWCSRAPCRGVGLWRVYEHDAVGQNFRMPEMPQPQSIILVLFAATAAAELRGRAKRQGWSVLGHAFDE
ncbi:perA, partial [Symbiodinium necroappetens]